MGADGARKRPVVARLSAKRVHHRDHREHTEKHSDLRPAPPPAVPSVPFSVFSVMNPLPFPRTPTRRFRNPFNGSARSRTRLPDRVAGWRRLSG
jgi:hypothetical protein